jgi:hypothetical protein
MELTFILIPVFVFVLLKMVIDHRAQARADNVKLLEEALKSPQVDRPTLESLTYQLTGHRPRPGASRIMSLVLAVGWLGLFVGLGLWVAGEMSNTKDMVMAGTIVAIVGFGFVTYPFALRELEARRQPQ